jgi:4-amino-4-deoxy-L-arabinose transferase-like glycosyltransferase
VSDAGRTVGAKIDGGRERSLFSGGMMIAWWIAAAGITLQMVTNGRYGYFRDELYFMACGDHLAWGYVDFAPLVAWLTRLSRVTLGDSLHAIRLLPALALGAEIVLTGLLTRALGGRLFAIFLACVSVLMAPVILGNATRMSMNPFEPLFWMGCVYFLLRAMNEERPELLVWCGVLLGLGLENKHSTAFFFVSLMAGLVLTPARKLIATKWFWIGAGIAVLLFLPNLLWQVANHFPTLEALRNVKATHKNVELPPMAFFRQQIMMLNPANVLVWLAGLALLLLGSRMKTWRVLGITYVVFLAIMMWLKGKDYYLAPIYPMLFAAGGIFWETVTEGRRWLVWTRVAVPTLVIGLGLIAAPLAVPILPVEKVVPYMEALGIKMSRTEVQDKGPLPQHFGDEFGWPEMVSAVAQLYEALPAEQRAKTGIMAGTYGDAGAIDFFGPKMGLPKAISAHQNYYLWGPREYTGESLIFLHFDVEDVRSWCDSVQIGPKLDPYYGMGEEHYTIVVCKVLKKPLAQVWPRFKVWN